MMDVVHELEIKVTLKFELAGMLCQIGLVAVPQDLLSKKFSGQALSPEEEQIYQMHPSIAANLLGQIPRLEAVTEIIANQREPYRTEPGMPLGARILNLCLEYDGLSMSGHDLRSAWAELRQKAAREDPRVLAAFERILFKEVGYLPRALPVSGLEAGMILSQNLRSVSGVLILARGQELTPIALERLNQIARTYPLPQAVEVLVPLEPKP